MNGFAKHNLGHTSPSQLNMWADAPCAWVAKYLYSKKFPFGVAAQVGVQTEKVVEEVLCGRSFAEALEDAQKHFTKYNALNPSEKDRARVEDIKYMADQVLEILRPYGEPEFIKGINGHSQQRIELKCNGPDWELPIIGYLDFVYPKHGLVIDLKTTMRCPSIMSRPHQRQAAVYSKAKGNMGVKFLYCTPKKSALLEVDDENDVLDEVKQILIRQERFLKLHDKETIKDIIPINSSSFYWDGAEGVRKEMYGV